MIDPRLLREDPDQIRAAQAKRGLSADVVDRALEADAARRTAIADFEQLRAEQKQLGKLIPRATGEEKAELLTRTRTLSADVKAAEAAQAQAEADWRDAVYAIPNPAAEESPAGGEDDYVVLSEHGTPRDFAAEGFEPRDHVELGRILGAIDVERGAKVSGSRFYYLTGVGADLELALVNMAMDQARSAGFTTMIPPTLVKPRAMEGTGFLGQAADDVYRSTARTPTWSGPRRCRSRRTTPTRSWTATRCRAATSRSAPASARRQARTAKDTRGIIRVHWFDKVEMFTYTTLEDAADEHARLLGWEQEWLDKLELAYRVIDVAAGDLGLSAQRKFDCEAWVPTQGRYRELTSTSNCTDFQTRRLDIRGRFAVEGGQPETRPVATLNGTLVAIPRTIVAILETHQQADGSVRVPAALQPYLQGREVLTPVRPVEPGA